MSYIPSPLDVRSNYAARGAALLDLSAPASVWFDDYHNGPGAGTNVPFGYVVSSGAGATTVLETPAQSSVLASSGATATRTAELRTGNAIYTMLAGSPASTKFYFVQSMQVTTAIDANATCGFMLRDGAGAIQVIAGVYGPSSTANFWLNVCGNTLDTLLAIDTSVHTWEMYSLADGNISFKIDGVAYGPLAVGAWTNGMLLAHVYAANGATAANRATRAFWSLFMTP